MKFRNSFLFLLFLPVCLLPIPAAHKSSQAAAAERVLRIKLNYTGAGAVDEKHKIYVLLFDANPLTASTLSDATSQATPPAPVAGVSHILARESAATKDGVITFHTVPVSPVYAVFFFDKTGTYNNGHADPSAHGNVRYTTGQAGDYRAGARQTCAVDVFVRRLEIDSVTKLIISRLSWT